MIFTWGTNTGDTDLGGNTITVTIPNSNTSASITVHPTYQVTYYKDILGIKNQDTSTSYYITIRVTNPLSDTLINTAELRIYSGTTLIDTVDLTATGDTSIATALGAGQTWRVDIYLDIDDTGGDENTPPSLTDNSFSLQVIYSPTTETPP